MKMQPMLACKLSGAIQFPVRAAPKLDGVRAVTTTEGLVSRTLKLIRNQFIQNWVRSVALIGFDGELIVGSETAKDVMQATTSGVMSADGQPDFTYHIFDLISDEPFESRYEQLKRFFAEHDTSRMKLVEQRLIANQAELDAYEIECLEQGYEGIIIRNPMGKYKHGRSTMKEGYLIKIKQFNDDEAIVIGYEEQMHNTNEDVRDALGHAKRSSAQAGLVGAGVLGALIVRDIKSGVEFGIGTGFTAAQRAELWHNRLGLAGQIVKYSHFTKGVKIAPRFPTFLGFRSKDDL